MIDNLESCKISDHNRRDVKNVSDLLDCFSLV